MVSKPTFVLDRRKCTAVTRLESLRSIATSVSADLADREGVDAVLVVGSTAAGYADEYSDVDLQVVGSIAAGERSVEDVHVEWTPVTREGIVDSLTGWEDDVALYTYATADLRYDRIDLADLLADYAAYPPDVRRAKLYAGWFYGSGNAFEARKARERGDRRAKLASAVAAAEQFAALTYLLDGRFPPYRKWLFRDLTTDLPGIDGALSGDVAALESVIDALKPQLRGTIDDDRIEKPYLFQPEFGPLG